MTLNSRDPISLSYESLNGIWALSPLGGHSVFKVREPLKEPRRSQEAATGAAASAAGACAQGLQGLGFIGLFVGSFKGSIRVLLKGLGGSGLEVWGL